MTIFSGVLGTRKCCFVALTPAAYFWKGFAEGPQLLQRKETNSNGGPDVPKIPVESPRRSRHRPGSWKDPKEP